MRKVKILFLFFMALCFLVFLTACAKQSNNAAANNATSSGNTDNIANRRPDFGQPDRPADVSGLVKSITGNEVTVIKLDFPDRASGTPADASGNGTGDNTSGQRSGNPGAFIRGGGTGAVIFQGGGGGGEGGNRTFFASGGGPGGAGGDSSQNRQQMLDRLKAMSSGDEAVIIPVGIKMLKPDTSNQNTGGNSNQRQQPNMVEATLADITTDKMIQIWLDPSVTDRKVAEFVLITR